MKEKKKGVGKGRKKREDKFNKLGNESSMETRRAENSVVYYAPFYKE